MTTHVRRRASSSTLTMWTHPRQRHQKVRDTCLDDALVTVMNEATAGTPEDMAPSMAPALVVPGDPRAPGAVSYTHLRLPPSARGRSRWSPYH